MARYAYTVIAQAYGQGNYDDCDYSCQGAAGTSTSSGGSDAAPSISESVNPASR